MTQEKEPLEGPQKKISITNGSNKDTSLLTKEMDGSAPLTKEQEVDKILHNEQDIKDTHCGIGFFKPGWLQYLARKECYILVYCLTGMTHGMFFTYTVSVLSTIEKRFRLTSKQTGTILSGNDISQVILSILLGYYGNYGHRPRWMSIGVMMAAGSGFAAALPHYIYGPGQDAIRITQLSTRSAGNIIGNITGITSKEKKQELCYFQPDIDCDAEDIVAESFVGPVILFFISQFCVGITVSIFYSIGVTYLDDNISKKSYPIYYAITFMLRILGPVTGFFIGGKCLSVWIDPTQQPNLARKDPRWYGAWWIGYLFIGCNLLFAGSLLMLFPRKLPATLKRETKRVIRQADKDEQAGDNRGIAYFASLAQTKKTEREKPTFQNLLKALRRIFTNKVWVGNLFNTVVYIMAASGYWNFKPKYLENQFRKSSSESSYYTGVASLVSLVLGTGLGGAVLRWAQPSPRFVTGYNIFITLLQSCSYLVLMFIGCPRVNVIGPVEGSVAPPCSSDCDCTDRFSPICSEDKTTLFYSPCYAGCTVANTSSSPIVYNDCRCITNSTDPLMRTVFDDAPNQESTYFGSAVSGYCEEPCSAFMYYLIIQTVVKTIASTGRVGSSLINIRSVADEDKGLALGTLTVCMSLFGFIPAPIIMGAIVDSACLVWDKTCGNYGNCWLYDSDKFRVIIHMVPCVLIFISVFGDIVVYYYSRQLDLYGKGEEEIDLENREYKPEEEQPLTADQENGKQNGKPITSDAEKESGKQNGKTITPDVEQDTGKQNGKTIASDTDHECERRNGKTNASDTEQERGNQKGNTIAFDTDQESERQNGKTITSD